MEPWPVSVIRTLEEIPEQKENPMPFLIAMGALIAAIVGGIILFAIGLEAIGIAVFLASIPFAIGAWMTSNDRRL